MQTTVTQNFLKNSQRLLLPISTSIKRKHRISNSITLYQVNKKKHAILLSDKDYIFDTMSLWKAWEQFSKKITLSNKYLIFKTEFTPSENKDLHPSCKIAYHVTFVNVLQTACLLSKHYNLFKQVFEKDFDPLKETLNITNPNSNLWKCLHAETPQNYYQEIGLLLGYGYENTQIFKWKNNRSSNSIQKNFFDKIIGTPSSNLNEVLQSPQPFSSTNFPLPTFITFFPHNSTQLQYAQEHTHITLYYENKDFVDSTLDILAPH